MPRRRFLGSAAWIAGGLALPHAAFAGAAAARSPRIRWTRDNGSDVFSAVSWEGAPLAQGDAPALLDAAIRLVGEAAAPATRLSPATPAADHGPLRAELRHQLHDSGRGASEDLLEAVLTVHNRSDAPQQVELAFLTSVQPSPAIENQRAYLPLNAAGGARDGRFAALGVKQFLTDSDQAVGSGKFSAHYLEPLASYPTERETRALLLAPCVSLSHPDAPARVSLFTSSLEPRRFRTLGADDHDSPHHGWHIGRCLTIPPGASVTERCWLYLHEGDASVAWRAFHQFGHHEEHPAIEWTREFRVHYFDFLSAAAGADGRRGDGYDADLAHFAAFHVGMATQHGYYPAIGDYIHPDRPQWQAMRGDKHGPAEMSLDLMRDRVRRTRATGAKAAVYLHPVLFDDASPLFEKLRHCVRVDAAGQPARFSWQGPDTVGKNWCASLASPDWRAHLLEQAGWIMELLAPDAIVVDETFAGLGYDHHPDRNGPISAGAIDFYRKLRTLVRSFGPDKAVFSSDCSMAPFVLWADGEGGDHTYPNLLGHPNYTREPVPYLAALGDKPWRPCAWHFRKMWAAQMKLAAQIGAGVGVSNGWMEYTGLARLPNAARTATLADIKSLLKP